MFDRRRLATRITTRIEYLELLGLLRCVGIGPEMNIIERRETFGWILYGINVYILHNKRQFILRACRHREL